MKTFLKLILFIVLFSIGLGAINHDFFTNMHEEGHLYNYDRDGVRATRKDFRTVRSDYYTKDGLLGGYGSVFIFAVFGYAITFFISFRQYWITGFFLGLANSAFAYPWAGTDFNRVAAWAEEIWSLWIYGMGGFLLAIWISFIIWKIVPEIHYIVTGEAPGAIKRNHPYAKEPTYLP